MGLLLTHNTQEVCQSCKSHLFFVCIQRLFYFSGYIFLQNKPEMHILDQGISPWLIKGFRLPRQSQVRRMQHFFMEEHCGGRGRFALFWIVSKSCSLPLLSTPSLYNFQIIPPATYYISWRKKRYSTYSVRNDFHFQIKICITSVTLSNNGLLFPTYL